MSSVLKCGSCSEIIPNKESGIECGKCSKFYHLTAECTELCPEQLDAIITKGETLECGACCGAIELWSSMLPTLFGNDEAEPTVQQEGAAIVPGGVEADTEGGTMEADAQEASTQESEKKETDTNGNPDTENSESSTIVVIDLEDSN